MSKTPTPRKPKTPRWYAYERNSGPGGDSPPLYIHTTRDYAEEVAREHWTLTMPDSAKWRGFWVKAIKAPPRRYLLDQIEASFATERAQKARRRMLRASLATL